MATQAEFVGRSEELEFIERLVEDRQSNYLLYLVGQGGLGKTRILQEVFYRYAEREDVFVAPVIDFDERWLRNIENLELRIAKEIGKQDALASQFHELRAMQRAAVGERALSEQRDRILQNFVSLLNEFAQKRRIVFLFDTVEKLDEAVLIHVCALLSQLRNAFLLLAGRPETNRKISALLTRTLGSKTITHELDPLRPEDTAQYLDRKLRDLHSSLDEQPRRNLQALVEGRPILIDLAANWLQLATPPQWLVQDLNALPSLQPTRDEFKRKLVEHITALRTPIDRLILVMSRIYPLDVAMIAELLHVPESEAQALYEEAKRFVFVKSLPDGMIYLHDEMREMVLSYVWPKADKTGKRQRRDSRIAATIYERKFDELQLAATQTNQNFANDSIEREFRRIAEEGTIAPWIEHALYAEVRLGYDIFVKNTQRLRSPKIQNYDFARQLAQLIKPYYDKLTTDQQFDFDVLHARLHYDTGDISKAVEMLRSLLRQYNNAGDQLSSVHNALGRALTLQGEYEEALEHQIRCLEIVQRTNPRSVPAVANQVGYISRLRDQLNDAEKYYTMAVERLGGEEALSTASLDLLASLLNNLGYIRVLRREYEQAEWYCSQAEGIWFSIGFVHQIARVEVTRGILYRDQDNDARSVDLLKQAVVRLADSNDFENRCRAQFHLGWSLWFRWEEINLQRILDWEEKKHTDFLNTYLLIEAKDAFDESRRLATRYGAVYALPGILHQMSNAYWWLGWIEDPRLKGEARTLNSLALKEGESRQDLRYVIDSIVGEAEFDFDEGVYDKIPSYALVLKEKYGHLEGSFRLYFGRIKRILADIAFVHGSYDEAREKYISAIPEIRQHGGFGKYSTRAELLRLQRKLVQLPIDEAMRWLDSFRLRWGSEPELLAWCENQRIGIRARRQASQ